MTCGRNGIDYTVDSSRNGEEPDELRDTVRLYLAALDANRMAIAYEMRRRLREIVRRED